MLVRRSQHTATLLLDGRVLIAGGGTPEQAQGSVELYDHSAGVSVHAPDLLHSGAASGTFRPVSPPIRPRSDHAAVLLSSGKVLVLGGDVSGIGASPTASAELFDPQSERFEEIAPMMTARRPYGV